MQIPSRLNLVVGVVWGAVALESLFVRNAELPPNFFPASALVISLIIMPLMFGAAALYGKHSPFYHPKLARIVDGRFGEGAFLTFLVRLKPILLFGFGALLQGLTNLMRTAFADKPFNNLFFQALPFVLGASFVLVHLILYRRKVIGVYPVSPETVWASDEEMRGRKMPLREALRKYWWTLIGVTLFPLMAFGSELLRVPFGSLVVPFFAAGLLACWPVLSGKAPTSFTFVAGALYMTGALLAIPMLALIRLFF